MQKGVHALRAGKPIALKDGDIVRFGSDSKLRVQVTPASSEATTVEQHLRADCDSCAQRLKVGSCILVCGEAGAGHCMQTRAWRNTI